MLILITEISILVTKIIMCVDALSGLPRYKKESSLVYREIDRFPKTYLMYIVLSSLLYCSPCAA